MKNLLIAAALAASAFLLASPVFAADEAIPSSTAAPAPAVEATPSSTAEAAPAEAAPSETTESAETSGATLDQRLTDLLQAVETVTKQRYGMIPRSIDDLVTALDEKEEGLVDPETGGKLLMNPKMAGAYEGAIKDPGAFVTFYADKPTPDKGHAVIFADGNIKYLSEDEFNTALEASRPRRLKPNELEDLATQNMIRREAEEAQKKKQEEARQKQESGSK